MICRSRFGGSGKPPRGIVMFAALIALIFLCVLALYLLNVSASLTEKNHVQDTADSIAESSAVWGARGMNLISYLNHLMGEGIALAAVHTSIAGRNVDGADLSDADRRRSDTADRLIHAWAPGARSVGGLTLTYNDAVRPLRAAMTVGQAKINLKERLASLYATQAILGRLPWIGPAIVAALNAVEVVIYAEWRALDALEMYARSTLPMQRLAFEQLAPGARRYAQEAILEIPRLTVETAERLAERQNLSAALDPTWPALPIEAEPSRAGESDHQRAMARSQSTRAAWPFVRYDRGPILTTTSALVLSGARGLFLRWTAYHTTARAQEFERRFGSLFVVRDSAPDRKGRESWTEERQATDRLFARLAFARNAPRRPFGSPRFADALPDGVVAYAQALLYNANSQRPDAAPAEFQREVGWDLLQWGSPVTSSGAYEYPEGPNTPGPFPVVHLNWQAKLVPATSRIDSAPAVIPAEFAAPIRRVVPIPPSLRTH